MCVCVCVCVCVLGVLTQGLGKNEVRARVSRRETLKKYNLYIHVHVHT